MCAVVIGVILSVAVGIKSVLLLIFLLLCKLFEDMEVSVNIVVECCREFVIKSVVCVPCAFFRRELKSAENTEGIGCCGIDGLALLDEVEFQNKRISVKPR